MRKILNFIVAFAWRKGCSVALLHFAGWRVLELRALEREDERFLGLGLRAEQTGNSYQRFLPDGAARGFPQTRVRKLGIWTLANSLIRENSKFPAILDGNLLLITPRIESGPYHAYPTPDGKHGGTIEQRGSQVLIAPPRKPASEVGEAIYVGTRAQHNWSHWLINFLPGAHLASKHFDNPSIPLIVSAGCKNGASRRESLEVFWGGRPVIEVPAGSNLKVRKLHFVEQPVSDSPRPHADSMKRRTVGNRQALDDFREAGQDHGRGGKTTTEAKKIFFARESFHTRKYTDRAHGALQELGFEPVFLNRLSFRDQVATVMNAEEIIGPAGSAFANVIFCEARTRILLYKEELPNWENWYAPLAEAAEASMFFGKLQSRLAGPAGEDDYLKNLKNMIRQWQDSA